jgi:hypothetical protein
VLFTVSHGGGTMRTLGYVVLAVLVAGCAASLAVPGPTAVNIVPPSPGLAPELAAFSGTWAGVWDGVLPSRLTVENIDAESATVVYAWGDDPGGYFKAGWQRYMAQVLPGGKLKFGSADIKFTFALAADRMSIRGERERGGRLNTVTMKKVGQ